MKTIAIAVSALGLAMAIPSVLPASAAPTQSVTLSCSKSGSTTISTNGGVDRVSFYWYDNTGSYVGSTTDYAAPYSSVTPNRAKTARSYVYWQGNNSGSTLYSVACK